MTTQLITNSSLRIELLRDRRGVYGIGCPETPWLCNAYQPAWRWPPNLLILRPDRFDGTKPRDAVLQKITGGFRRSIFGRSIEEQLRRHIHHEALRRAGLPWPRRRPERWWSTDKIQQIRNRGIYHGLRLLSLHVINDLIDKAIAEAADADAIRAARRSTFCHRESIYRACAMDRHALQLTNTFPVLAIMIYCDGYNIAERKNYAAELVQRGARLRDVAAAMAIPMALRRIRPGAAHLAFDAVSRHPDWLCFMPETTLGARVWLHAVHCAYAGGSTEFAEWVARRAAQIPGNLREVLALLRDLRDWAWAAMPPEARILPEWQNDPAGREFITRPFTPSMSLKTVMTLSADWHEAVANHLSGPDFAFPTPWFPASKQGDLEIIPIESSAELYREGRAMHQRVGTYRDIVQSGVAFVYSIRRAGERVATMALRRCGKNVLLEELRGPCNAAPCSQIVTMARNWLRAQALPETPNLTNSSAPDQTSDSDIPF
jgi:hypothetical protein